MTRRFLCQKEDTYVPLALIDGRGRVLGYLRPWKLSSVPQRQYQALGDPELSVSLSRGLIAAKIRNQIRVVAHLASESPPEAHELRILAKRARSAQNKSELLGIEGAAARLYFSALGRAMQIPNFRRTRKPPGDPANALLSYGYGLLLVDCLFALASVDLDPLMGYYHTQRPGRPALALDLMEEFRGPVVDVVVARLVAKRALDPEEDFRPVRERGKQGFHLGPRAKRILIEKYHQRMKGFRKRLLAQADALRKLFTSGKPYKPYVFR